MNIEIVNIEVLEQFTKHFPLKGEVNLDMKIDTKVNIFEKNEIVEIITTIGIKTATEEEISRLQTKVSFMVEDLADRVFIENNTKQLPKELIQDLTQESFSTSRGILWAMLRKTDLGNFFLPYVKVLK